MIIRDLTAQECRDVLGRITLGRLACARDNQPYIVPIYFAYEPDRLFSFTTMGRKIEWMRKNPKVCVEADEVRSHFEWMSVIATGRYQELPNKPETNADRLRALQALEKRMLWWQTAIAVKELPTRHQTAEPLFYCIHIDSITGLRAFPDAVESRIGLASHARTI